MSKVEKFIYVILILAIGAWLAVIAELFSRLMAGSSTAKAIFLTAGLIGLAFMAIACKWRQEERLRLILVLLSSGVALYVMEMALSFRPSDERLSLRQRAEIAATHGKFFDTRSRLEVIQALRTRGIDAYPTIHCSEFIMANGIIAGGKPLYQLGGIANKLTVYCNESGEYTIYQADEYGFNNPPGSWSEGKIEIILVGDSFAHGACVKQGEDIAGRLRQMDHSVINLGYGGNGPLMALAALKEYAEPLKPRLVIWTHYEENDLLDVVRDSTSTILMRYLQDGFSQKLMTKQSEIDQALSEYFANEWQQEMRGEKNRARAGEKLIRILRLGHLQRRLGLDIKKLPNDADPPALFEKIMKTARDRTSVSGGRLYFVYLPEFSRYGLRVNHQEYRSRQKVLALLKSLDIPVIDMHEGFASHGDPLRFFPFRMKGHYTAEGYQMVAEALRQAVNEALAEKL